MRWVWDDVLMERLQDDELSRRSEWPMSDDDDGTITSVFCQDEGEQDSSTC